MGYLNSYYGASLSLSKCVNDKIEYKHRRLRRKSKMVIQKCISSDRRISDGESLQQRIVLTK